MFSQQLLFSSIQKAVYQADLILFSSETSPLEIYAGERLLSIDSCSVRVEGAIDACVEEWQLSFVLVFDRELDVSVLLVEIVEDGLRLCVVLQRCKHVIDVSPPVRDPQFAQLLLVLSLEVGHEDVREQWSEGLSHGYTVDLVVELSVELEVGLL